jgi:hypothetical protein
VQEVGEEEEEEEEVGKKRTSNGRGAAVTGEGR